MTTKHSLARDRLRKKLYEAINEEEEYDPDETPWPPKVDPNKVEINARISLLDLDKRIRYFERFFGGGGKNIIADVRAPKNAAADLVVEAMESKHKEVVIKANILMANAQGMAEKWTDKADELMLSAQQTLSQTKATMALHLRATAKFEDSLEMAERRMEELQLKEGELAQRVQSTVSLTAELELSAQKYATRNAILTVQGDVASLRTKINGLERRQQAASGGIKTRGRALERTSSPIHDSSGHQLAREQGSIEELIRGAQIRAISERRGTSPTRGCFTPNTSRQPSCEGRLYDPLQLSGQAMPVTRGHVLSRTPSPN